MKANSNISGFWSSPVRSLASTMRCDRCGFTQTDVVHQGLHIAGEGPFCFNCMKEFAQKHFGTMQRIEE